MQCLNRVIDEHEVPTCFKNPDKPTCIDLILTNKPNLFQHSSAFETGFSNFCLLTVVTEFKMGFQNQGILYVDIYIYKIPCKN